MQRPFFSQSPYRVGSGPLGPPISISFSLGFVSGWREVLTSLCLLLSEFSILFILFYIMIQIWRCYFLYAALQERNSKVILNKNHARIAISWNGLATNWNMTWTATKTPFLSH